MFPVGDRDVNNPQERSRRTLAAVWHSINSDWCSPCSGFICPVMHQCSFRVSKKPSVKADLAIHVVNTFGQCMSVSLILGFKF